MKTEVSTSFMLRSSPSSRFLLSLLHQVALALSVWRLRALSIHVIEARRIIMAGALEIIAFDKTGTLT